jgi:hypothetical protein
LATTADTLVSRSLVRAGWPANDGEAFLTHAEILALADEEITREVFPLVRKADAAWYIHTEDYSITASQELYELPARAVEQIADIVLVDSEGNEFSMTWMALERAGHPDMFQTSRSGRYTAYFTGDFVALRPIPDTTLDTLRVKYERQPGTLTLLTNAETINALTGATRLTMDSTIPAGWTTGTLLDIINAGNAHQVLNADLAVTGTGASYVDVASYSSFVATGDYVSTAGTTPIVPLPDQAVPLLILRVAQACHLAHKEYAAAASLNKLIDEATDTCLDSLKPRNQGEPKYLVPQNDAWSAGPWGAWR